ncbi:MAG TPA: polar localization protein TipN [Caulobacteraceae bacterium]|jgi:hypothetical protein
MKPKRRPPLNLSQPVAPDAAPDNDLDLPAMERTREELSTTWLRRATAQPALEDESGAASPEPEAADPAEPVHQPSLDDASSPGATAPPPVPTAPARPPQDNVRIIYGLAGLASLLWAALAVFAYGYQRPLSGIDYLPFQTAVFIVLTLAPIGFIWIFAYGLRQTGRIAAEVARAQALSRTMLQPAAIAATETGSVLQTVRGEIEAATQAAAHAREQLTALRQALSEETARLSEAADLSAHTAATLGDALGQERRELGALSERLDVQASALSDSVARQARVVSEASDLAQAQIGEAEAALAARAADLAAAAGQASDAARIASDDLSRQVMRLETASVGVSDQVRAVEETLTQQRASLVAVAHGLRADHEDFAVRLEAQQAQLSEHMLHAQAAATEMAGATGEGVEAVRGLADEALGRCRDLTELLRQERDLLAAGALQSLGAVAEAARFEREAMQAEAQSGVDLISGKLGEAQALTARHSELARTRIEELSEASFAAGQRAEAAYEARVEEARSLISKSAELIDDAAAASAGRIEKAAADARATLAELQGVVAEFEVRAQRLPQETSAQAAALRETLAHSFDSLLDSARKAAEETQAIDKAFQERVRHNYEMLSEAVRLMGVIGPASRQALRSQMDAQPPAAAPAAPPRAEAPAPPPAVEALPPEPQASAPAAPTPRAASPSGPPPRFVAPRPANAPEAEAPAPVAGLRPRLRLAPTESDSEVSALFETAAAKPAAPAEPWNWQDLLTNMDDGSADEQLAERLIGEIEDLGLNASALLPPARVEELASVIGSGDADGSRLVIRHLAPVAVRKLSRRLLTDRPLRLQAERFVRQYEASVADAAKKDVQAIASLLGNDTGRAYLLFDAAAADLA